MVPIGPDIVSILPIELSNSLTYVSILPIGADRVLILPLWLSMSLTAYALLAKVYTEKVTYLTPPLPPSHKQTYVYE